jgi:hypothetical protein
LNGKGPDVDEWQEKLRTYGRDYMSLGAAEIQKRLTVDLPVIQQQLDSAELRGISSKLATLFAKTYPGSDGATAVSWYRTAATAADRSVDDDARVWVRGRAAIALGYEGASLGMAETFASQALAISGRPSIGQLNTVVMGVLQRSSHSQPDRTRLLRTHPRPPTRQRTRRTEQRRIHQWAYGAVFLSTQEGSGDRVGARAHRQLSPADGRRRPPTDGSAARAAMMVSARVGPQNFRGQQRSTFLVAPHGGDFYRSSRDAARFARRTLLRMRVPVR